MMLWTIFQIFAGCTCGLDKHPDSESVIYFFPPQSTLVQVLIDKSAGPTRQLLIGSNPQIAHFHDISKVLDMTR